jgi:hypothetical protein
MTVRKAQWARSSRANRLRGAVTQFREHSAPEAIIAFAAVKMGHQCAPSGSSCRPGSINVNYGQGRSPGIGQFPKCQIVIADAKSVEIVAVNFCHAKASHGSGSGEAAHRRPDVGNPREVSHDPWALFPRLVVSSLAIERLYAGGIQRNHAAQGQHTCRIFPGKQSIANAYKPRNGSSD